MSRFTITETPLAGLKIIERQQFGDNRGSLFRLFCTDELAAAGWSKPIAQINHTLTKKQGTIRGMHFQRSPHAEMKLVMCIRGLIWDVAVDLRPQSNTYLQWHAEELSANNLRSLLIPEGFAHGFQTLTDNCELLYLHTEAYAPHSESAVNPFDPKINIRWPQNLSEISQRDKNHPMLDTQFIGALL